MKRLAFAAAALLAAALLSAAPAHADTPTAHTGTHLDSIVTALNGSITTPGTSWGVDPATGQVFLSADSTVPADAVEKLRDLIEPYGDAVRLDLDGGVLTPTIAGGERIVVTAQNYGCSLGFNVRAKADPNARYFLTAGHCTVGATGVATWSTPGGTLLGSDAGGYFPTNDFGLVAYENADIAKPGTVNLFNGSTQDITTSRNPVVGEPVCRSGGTTGHKCGTVKAVNVSVRYAEGTVTGLFRTDICSDFGDSGGPIFRGTAALGLHSGMSTNPADGSCNGYEQPVNEALAWYGMEVY